MTPPVVSLEIATLPIPSVMLYKQLLRKPLKKNVSFYGILESQTKCNCQNTNDQVVWISGMLEAPDSDDQ